MLKLAFIGTDNKSYLDTLIEIFSPENYQDSSTPALHHINDMILPDSSDSLLSITINNKMIVGSEDSTATNTWDLLTQFNNEFFQILKGEKSSGVIDLFGDCCPKDHKVYLLFNLKDGHLFFTLSNKIHAGYGKYIYFKDEPVNFYQAVEEVAGIVKKFMQTFEEAVKQVSPKDWETVKKSHFNTDTSVAGFTWLPLEQEWEKYKSEQGE